MPNDRIAQKPSRYTNNETFRRVSIIIPCRNEGAHIASCLRSILEFDYDKSLIEVIVVDGMSTDATRAIVTDYCRLNSFIRMIDNPKLITPIAMNLGIQASEAEFVVILGVHTIYPHDYITRLVKGILQHKADAFGGALKITPKDDTRMGYALAMANSHVFSMGNVHFRTGSSKVRKVDTVPYAIYRRKAFDIVGMFNPKLVRGQDREFNTRLDQAGSLLVLDPSIRSIYYVRSKFVSYMGWIAAGGFWVFYASRFTNTRMRSWRNYIPLIFLLYHLILFGSYMSLPGVITFVLATPLILYWLCVGFFSVMGAVRSKRILYIVLLGVIFPTTHFSYAAGSLYGILKRMVLGKQL